MFFRSTDVKVVDIRTGPKKQGNRRRLITDSEQATTNTASDSKDSSAAPTKAAEPVTIEIGT